MFPDFVVFVAMEPGADHASLPNTVSITYPAVFRFLLKSFSPTAPDLFLKGFFHFLHETLLFLLFPSLRPLIQGISGQFVELAQRFFCLCT